MPLFRRTFLALAALLVVGLLDSFAHAQCGSLYGTSGFPFPTWMGYSSSPYSLGQIPTPPYFAIHPPVYYSYPVPRSYGYSPYAYPGEMQTPEIVAPEVIENPHVDEKKAEKVDAIELHNVKVIRAQVIENPFVRAEVKAAFQARLAKK